MKKKKKKATLTERITSGVWALWLISGSAVDSESWIPLIVCGLSTLLLWVLTDAENTKSRKRRRQAHGYR